MASTTWDRFLTTNKVNGAAPMSHKLEDHWEDTNFFLAKLAHSQGDGVSSKPATHFSQDLRHVDELRLDELHKACASSSTEVSALTSACTSGELHLCLFHPFLSFFWFCN